MIILLVVSVLDDFPLLAVLSLVLGLSEDSAVGGWEEGRIEGDGDVEGAEEGEDEGEEDGGEDGVEEGKVGTG